MSSIKFSIIAGAEVLIFCESPKELSSLQRNHRPFSIRSDSLCDQRSIADIHLPVRQYPFRGRLNFRRAGALCTIENSMRTFRDGCCQRSFNFLDNFVWGYPTKLIADELPVPRFPFGFHSKWYARWQVFGTKAAAPSDVIEGTGAPVRSHLRVLNERNG